MAAAPPGIASRLVEFCEELRSEGVSVGTAEILDAFEALEAVPWTDQAVLQKTMSIIVKHRTDLDLVAERVGVKLGDGILGARRAG